MPYATNQDLPDIIKEHLPYEAQDIFRAAFNDAYKEYYNPKKRVRGGSHEAVAYRVAWSAVKKRYTKKGLYWIKNSEL